MTVRGTEGRETLLKLALPAPQGSGDAAGRLTRRGRPAAVRQLDDFLGLPAEDNRLITSWQLCSAKVRLITLLATLQYI